MHGANFIAPLAASLFSEDVVKIRLVTRYTHHMKKLILLLTTLSLIGCIETNTQPEKPLVCSEKPETGRCRAAFQKYFFNAEKQSCEMFIWGGCGGNVPFETKLECEKTCL